MGKMTKLGELIARWAAGGRGLFAAQEAPTRDPQAALFKAICDDLCESRPSRRMVDWDAVDSTCAALAQKHTRQLAPAAIPRRSVNGEKAVYHVAAVENPAGLSPGRYYFVRNPSGERSSVYTLSCLAATEWAACQEHCGNSAAVPSRSGMEAA